MKSLKDYLIESNQTFEYRIKIAGDLDKDNLEKLKRDLNQFKVISISDIKTTPITKNPYGFPGLNNVEIHIVDIEFEYPASSQQIVDLARLNGFDPNKIRVMDKAHDESMTKELEDTLTPNKKANLEDTRYPKPTPEQQKAKKDYSQSYKNIVKDAKTTKMKTFGKKQSSAKFLTDEEPAKDSLFGNTNKDMRK